MSVQQPQSQQQYNAAKPSSKSLTIIDSRSDDAPYWTIKSFYLKGYSKVNGAKNDTRKVKIKVNKRHWPFGGVNSNANNSGGKVLSWFFGNDVVVTHTKLDYDVYSGHVDDITERNMSYKLELYVTEVSDRP